MKFLDQARFSYSWLADDQHQLAVALPRPLPAPDQHGDFLVATHKRCLMALARPTSAAACPYQPEKRHRPRHALQNMGAALLGYEKTGDLTLHPRCHHDCAWLCERLDPSRGIRCIAVNLPGCIDHYRPDFDADRALSAGLRAPAFFWFSSTSALWIESAARAARSASFSWATG